MNKKMMAAGVLLLAAVILAVTGYQIYRGRIQLNRPDTGRYPIRGVDVSSYQGEIDWDVLARQGIAFAFIKATEGSGHVDPCFSANFSGAAATNLRLGAYHFFSYDSPGETQAQNFIDAVPVLPGMLPPVVDLEFYGDYGRNPMEAAQVRAILTPLLERLEAHYGTQPILYVTRTSYDLYVRGHYDDYDIWGRSLLGKPSYAGEWTFWQYTSLATLEGYRGDEEHIDLNVFYGSEEAWARYGAV